MKFLMLPIFLLSMSSCVLTLDQLRTKYAWPSERPAVTTDFENMCFNERQLLKVLSPNVHLIVELGSWLGGSALFFLKSAPQATLIAIDHWKGSLEHHQVPYWAQKLPTLYEKFLLNCWDYKDRLIPMRTTTLEGLQELADMHIYPDLVYVDAGHDYASVLADLEKTYELFPEALIVGDDWSWFMVRLAVTQFSLNHQFRVFSDENFWQIVK